MRTTTITAQELHEKYILFFKEKKHEEISGKSLIPENDPTVLFTTAGMQPLVPYLLGESHPSGSRLVNCQKCIRTGDIEAVGDFVHLTCFEMLGNWSLGDYFKEESLAWSLEFLTSPRWLHLDVHKLSVTVFAGDANAPADDESARIWVSLGMPKDRIAYLGAEDNWWAGGLTGPCGPDSEIFYWVGKGDAPPGSNKASDPANWMEIWNNVFMEYNRIDKNTLVKLPRKNVDTGMGLERTTTVLQNKTSVFQTEIFLPIIESICTVAYYKYGTEEGKDRSVRIIADHLRSAVFILGDPARVLPSNVGAGYVLRRLLRRALRHGHKLGIENAFLAKPQSSDESLHDSLSQIVINNFCHSHPELSQNAQHIVDTIATEESRFIETLKKGENEFNKILPNLLKNKNKIITGRLAFKLYDTYGYPLELTEELAAEVGLRVDTAGFDEEFRKHQELSRSSSGQLFKGGLADQGEAPTRYHTTTHLLHRALKNIVGEHVNQKGSNITAERLRFDFSHPEPLTKDQIQKVEEQVNQIIQQDLPVSMAVMKLEEAKGSGATALFGEKYDAVVKVYSIGNYSKEVCGGPHVKSTGQLGTFKIQKEQSSSAGVRRIYAVLE